jgi:hypothetical protein
VGEFAAVRTGFWNDGNPRAAPEAEFRRLRGIHRDGGAGGEKGCGDGAEDREEDFFHGRMELLIRFWRFVTRKRISTPLTILITISGAE